MFEFTALNGARSNSSASQSLLELDGGIKILVDVGWDVTFDPNLLADIEKHTPTLSFVLLTHATLSHLGAFVHCQRFIPQFSQIPVYATLPVITFGATLLKELYRIKPTETDDTYQKLQEELGPTPEEIDRIFSQITPLKYSQPHQPKPSFFSAPLDDLTVTAYSSGHTLGGTIWHIQHEMERIVYSVDWNIVRENVIPVAAWFGGIGGSEVIEALRNPTALVCSSRGATQVASANGRKARDDTILDHIKATVSRGGSVIIPAFCLPRLLEMAWVLEKSCEEATADSPLRKAKFYVASRSSHRMLRDARNLLDWMNESIGKEYEEESSNGRRVFQFRHLKLLEKSAKFEKALNGEGPKVIITSDISMDTSSFSWRALSSIAQSSENLILLTDDQHSDFVMATLSTVYESREDGVAVESLTGSNVQLEQVYGGGHLLELPSPVKRPLDQADSQSLREMMSRRQVETEMASGGDALVGITEDAVEDDASSSSSDESDDEHQGKVLTASAAIGRQKNKIALSDEDLGVSVLLRKKGVHDYDVRNRKGRNSVFPYTHSRGRGDEYGDYIRPEDFLRAEEKEGAAEAVPGGGDEPRGKRKWEVSRQADEAKAKRLKRNQSQAQSSNSPGPVDDSRDTSDDSDDDNDVALQTESSTTCNARLASVDFNSLHDQRSLQMLIPLIGSRRVILISGSDDETNKLAEDCKDLLAVKDSSATEESLTTVFAPARGVTVDASVDSNTWDVKLGKDLFKKLNWAPVQGRNIATLTGEVKIEPSDREILLPDRTKRAKLMKGDAGRSGEASDDSSTSGSPVLDVVSANSARSALSTNNPIHVGDVVLKELQRFMVDAGHRARFAGGGTLLVDDVVAIRKLGTGKIVLEGLPVSSMSAVTGATRTDSFTQVKRKIYEGLPVVAAG